MTGRCQVAGCVFVAAILTVTLYEWREPENCEPELRVAEFDWLKERSSLLGWDWDGAGLGWLSRRLDPYREGLRRLESSDPAVKVLDEADWLHRVRGADVVLVAENHTDDLTHLGASRLIEILRTSDLEVGLVVEAIPGSEQAELDSALSDPTTQRERLGELLTRVWPYPVVTYGELLYEAARHGVAVIGAGLPSTANPDHTVEDWKRRPSTVFDPQGESTPEHRRQWTEEYFVEGNELAAETVQRWLRSSSSKRRIAVVVFGFAHHLGSGRSLEQLLRKEALHVVTVIPFLAEWELAIRATDQTQGLCLEVLPGVIRPALIRDSDIRKQADIERRR